MTDTMSVEVFRANEAAIAVEVTTILTAKGKSRSRFRIVALYERETGDLLGEVFRTTHGPVLIYRGIDWDEPYDAVDGHVNIGYRTPTNYTGLDPMTGDAGQAFQIRSHLRRYHLRGDDFRTHTYPGDLIIFR